jgi:hypothetical protein
LPSRPADGWYGADFEPLGGCGRGTQSTVAPKRPKMQGRKLGRCFFQETVLVQFLFEDEVGVRPLDEVTDPAVLDEIAPIRSFVESSLKELSREELDVVFWEDKSGVLKMTLRGPDDVVNLAKSLIGDRAAIPPTQH